MGAYIRLTSLLWGREESIADHVQRPLLRMDMTQLGYSAIDTERSLRETFRVAEKWNAVNLLDEADVFLEQRRDSDLQRNGIVAGEGSDKLAFCRSALTCNTIAVFLRALEYYSGILFLTTNRMSSMDSAFQSRIHLSLRYPPLSHKSRCSIWKEFLTRPGVRTDPELLTNDFLDAISTTLLNGRQIKNAVRIAHSLARSELTPIHPGHLNTAMGALKCFEEDSGSDITMERESDDVQIATKRRRTQG